MFRISAVRGIPSRRLAPGLLAAALLLSACTNPDDFDEPLPDLGDFRLGYNVVVASKMKKVPISREATEEEWVSVMKAAVQERFGRYQGDKLYHIGISIEGYMLAPPGIPLVLSPKSGLIINATIWDDAAGGKINETPKQFTVLESFSSDTLVGSGLTQTKEEQMTNLARNAAKLVEDWLLENRAWFGEAPGPGSLAGIAAGIPLPEPEATPAATTTTSAATVTPAATATDTDTPDGSTPDAAAAAAAALQ